MLRHYLSFIGVFISFMILLIGYFIDQMAAQSNGILITLIALIILMILIYSNILKERKKSYDKNTDEAARKSDS